MLTSPFESQKRPQSYLNNVITFEESDIIFVADMFSDEYTGGAELTTDNIINKREQCNGSAFRIKAQDLTIEKINL